MSFRLSPRTGRSSERGISLVVTLMVSVAITALSLTAIFLASTSIQVAHKVSARQQGLFVAEAGLEQARAVLGGYASSDWSFFLGGLTQSGTAAPATGIGLPPEQRPTVENRNRRGRLLRNGIPGTRWLYNVCYPSEIQATSSTPCLSTDSGTYTVYARDNAIDLRSSGNPDQIPHDTDSILILRVEAQTPDLGTRVMIEAGLQLRAGSFAAATYGGVNENISNTNTLISNIDYSSAGAVVHSGT